MFGHSAIALAMLPEIAVLVKDHLNRQAEKQPLTAAEKDVWRACTAALTCGVALLVTSDYLGLILAMPVVVQYLDSLFREGDAHSVLTWLKRPHAMLLTQVVTMWVLGLPGQPGQ